MSIRRLFLASAVACLVAVPAASASQPAPTPVCTATSCTITFPYIGDTYAWTVPSNLAGPIAFDVKGAKGGTPSGAPGGSGARVQAQYAPTAGEVLTITPGGAGGWSGAWTPGGGGFNGGAAGFYNYTTAYGAHTNTFGGGGGGASDVRSGGTALTNRILVAAGGGGGAYVEDYLCYGQYCDPGRYYGNGGAGGRVGANGTGSGYPGAGATQSAGGAGGRFTSYNVGGAGMLGLGGSGNGDDYYGGGGGGGGGYYGGGGGTFGNKGAGGGGGGSSWAAANLSSVTYTSGYGSGDGSVIATFPISAAPMLMKASPTPMALMDGSTYAYRFTATGSPAAAFTVASGALPAGMTLDTTTGMLSGTPTTAGTSTFSIAATNAHGTATSGQLRITAGNTPMFTRMTAPPTAGLHMRYGYTFRTMGSPAARITVAKGALPPGLTLKAGATPGNAMLVGRPTRAGRYSFTLAAKSSAGSTTQRLTLTVAPQAPMPMGAPLTVSQRADGRMVLHAKVLPAAGSPMRKVHIAVYAPKSAIRTRQDIPPGTPSIPNLGELIASGTATAGTGATAPIDVEAVVRGDMDLASNPAVILVITGTGASGLQAQQIVMGHARMR